MEQNDFFFTGFVPYSRQNLRRYAMKHRKQLIALFVCLVMVLGMLPTGILAAEAPAKSINFMDAASAGQYTVINQRSAKVLTGWLKQRALLRLWSRETMLK